MIREDPARTEDQQRNQISESRVLKQSCESLLGLCAGMLADGVLNNEEILFLNNWLTDNQALASEWPGDIIYTRVKDILADGFITEEERNYIKQTLSDLIGGTLTETGETTGSSCKLPIDDVDRIVISNHTFCFYKAATCRDDIIFQSIP